MQCDVCTVGSGYATIGQETSGKCRIRQKQLMEGRGLGYASIACRKD